MSMRWTVLGAPSPSIGIPRTDVLQRKANVPRFDAITLMPELYPAHLSLGVTRRAFDGGGVEVRVWPLRDHGEGAYRRVDDRPFGGGPGMVMLADPLQRCLNAVRADRGADVAPLIHFTPTGRRLDQALVRELATGPGAILLCGRYEGIDQRFLDRHQRLDLSLGDFVLSGGDLPALVLLDAVARLQPGVLQDPQSHQQDSFEGDGLLEGPHYSRPEVWHPPADTNQGLGGEVGERGEGIGDSRADDGSAGLPVPPVLLSGHHAQIARWRREQSLALTAQRRPDLLEAARRAGRLSEQDEAFLRALPGLGYTRGF